MAAVMRENDQLKSQLTEYERASIQLKSYLNGKEQQVAQLESDVSRLK
jgi:hypothetical protein